MDCQDYSTCQSVVLTQFERVTDNYIAMRISGKTSEAVMEAMNRFRADYSDQFSRIFKTITTDNGSEFKDFSKVEEWGTQVYFVNPDSWWERPQN